MILDFLEDDAFFAKDDKRIKSKTEFFRREKQESEEFDPEEFQFPTDAEDYLNSILPNNSIKFKKHAESVSTLFNSIEVLIFEPEESVTRLAAWPR